MTYDDIRAAADRIRGHARVTPLIGSPFLDEIAGRHVLVKVEALQKTGSFKYRGARAALSALDAETRARGVIAFSSGNHAQGVALAASEFGAPAVIVMPSDAPQIKIANTRALGGEVVLYDRENDDRDALGDEIARTRGLTLIKPFDNPDVIAGQGTVGLEIAQQTRVDEADVFVCCGGGGLTAGVALALAAEKPQMSVRPAEPQGFDDVIRSLASGRIERTSQATGSICDAILTRSPGELTFPILHRLCAPGIAVSDDDARRAMAAAFSRLRVVLEPGGAVALAAALFHRHEDMKDTVIVVATGGNVDAAVFCDSIAGFEDAR